MKKLLILLCLLFLPFLFPKQSFADSSNFAVASQVTYTVASSGNTHVIFTVNLKNTTDKYYASSYTVHVGFKDIHNVVASDTGGTIPPQVKNTGTGEDITLNFNNKALGLNASLPFQFSFDTSEVASLNGSIWEVNIPGLSNTEDFSNFTVHVVVPSYFGKATYMKPQVGDGTLTFTKDQLGTSGISLAFGDKQVYKFHLTYHLKDDQLFPVKTEIALPPNTTYQHIEIDDISPKPQNVTTDTDGNWLAQYQLSSGRVTTVTATGKAYLSLTPTKTVLNKEDIHLFTKQQPYWQTSNSQIQTLAQQLKTPEAIYDYVVKTLHYDFARISDTQVRLGAVGVLQHPDQAVCLEFTDLFIAIARAAGIPAREIDGYGYTQNTSQRPLSLQKEILHAWPEYYDATQETWVMVDPTWQNTTGGVDYFNTFDYDHLSLVVKGISSTYPVPAGGYKLPGQQSEKDVAVTFGPQSVEPDPSIVMVTNLPNQFIAGLPISGNITLQNTGQVLFPTQVLLASSTFSPQQEQKIQEIPPFGHLVIPLSLGKTAFLTNTTDVATITLAGKSITKSIQITAFSWFLGIVLGGVFIAILSISISIITRRSRRVSIP